jgi:RimJ/RimL family protein N-acetyltransferase
VAAVEATFVHLDVAEVISLIRRTNRRSVGVARRLGMRHEREVRHPELDQQLRVYVLARRAQPGSWRAGR